MKQQRVPLQARFLLVGVIVLLLGLGVFQRGNYAGLSTSAAAAVKLGKNPERTHVDAATAGISFFRESIFTPNSPFTGASLLDSPTVLQFGPDGRLYVGQFNGRIFALTLNPTTHKVTAVQLIETIYNFPNTNSDGSPAPSVKGRQLIGLLFDPASTSSNVIMYTAHSDPRYGYNNDTTSQLINTRSGTISKLTSADGFATYTNVIVGMPRSRENHSTNSIVWGPGGWMYIANASNTNDGAPSAHFSNLPEFYLSASILRANVKSVTFTTPLDVSAVNSKPQLDALAGKFEIYGSGYRNVYDMVWHTNGKLYANVNGGNNGYGNTPGPSDGCSYTPVNPGYLDDTLRIVTQGSYGGHPNPARGECVLYDGSYQGAPRPPKYVDPILTYYGRPSTNGIAQYTSNEFSGAMQNNLIVATYGQNQDVSRIALNANGSVNKIERLAQFNQPLDVVTDASGVIYVAEFGGDAITILEPENLPNCPPPLPYSSAVDSDKDGYSDLDEDQNSTNMCSKASVPSDFDKDFLSDLNDPDDDNDGILDVNDQLYFDAANGTNTQMPVVFEWNPGDAPLGKVANTGFTGVQITTNGTRTIGSNIAVGAAGGFTNFITTPGTNAGSINSQDNAVQIGFNPNRPFKVESRLTEPWLGRTPEGSQAAGIFFGPNQDNYVKIVATADRDGNGVGGDTGLQFVKEVNGTLTVVNSVALAMPGANAKNIDIRLLGNPTNQTIDAYYQLNVSGSWQALGTTNVPLGFFGNGTPAGILTTNYGSTTAISFIFDFFHLEYNDIVVRINSGDDAKVVNGVTWSADSPTNHPYSVPSNNYILGGPSCPQIFNTDDDIIYCSERSSGGTSDKVLRYTIPVSQTGKYYVRLHFAEIYWGLSPQGGGVGSRKFNVTLEGNTVLTNFDIFAEAGGSFRAITKTFSLDVNDGQLNINFLANQPGNVDQAKVSGIEVWGPVLEIPPATQTAIAVTSTAVANQTATSVATTSTAVANQTATSVANQTATSVAATSTAVANQTATSVANQTATSVAATSTAVANQTATAVVNQTATSVAATTTATPQLNKKVYLPMIVR
ncbi:MAG: PQQ-dependent sugar dehydrogenase [Herpetosiphon sp.]|nr:PQQ-dependent sugar dehydrogenase [Herpetosiphon sp.]